MHFTYRETLDTTELCQGDILERTPEIDKLLELVHPHFYKKKSNLFFMVLTQSCDLVLRSGGECKAPYITIAPVRPINAVLGRQIKSMSTSGIDADLPVLTQKSKSKLSEFLSRLYNNNESGFFFLEAAGTVLPSDCCAFLNLSIALKASEHYKTCLAAKRIQLDNTFQAKLGWLVGQMYSRVGTNDWDSTQLKKKIQTKLEDAAIWIPDSSAQPLTAALQEWKKNSPPEAKLDKAVIEQTLNKVPSKKSLLVQQVENVLTIVLNQQLKDSVETANNISRIFKKRLEQDAGFTGLSKS